MGIIENGNYIEVHPTFLYESIGTLIIFIILTILQRKR
ncbi:MAG TPA: prolipoprotein diacylglyceryl transferase, partial [Clostridiales bacterium]|nr:prolipoprotein diacylglyceryl transferase [Clostridiales bacterium]